MGSWKRLPNGLHRIEWEGRSYELRKHPGRPDDKGRVGRERWFLHQMLAGGVTDPAPDSAGLGSRVDRAKELAVLHLEGWSVYYVDGARGELWRRGEDVRPLDELLAGAHRA
ncbi:hypothetical protein ACFCX4_09075 [Kitasatospora sp. NPDC056327]|uniref:hypothetical protein n=1 Tax=Kitasatospora sp. NPDC056327 TaxID=3345785 RepID=UPI0035E015F2